MVPGLLSRHSPAVVWVRFQVIWDFYLAHLSANYTAYVANLLLHYRVFHNNRSKIIAYCYKIKGPGPGNSLGLLAAHQIWSV